MFRFGEHNDCLAHIVYHLQVEDRLFRVHRYFLVRESLLFQDMFPLPSGDIAAEGQDDHYPVCLPEVKKQEFVSFMRFLYYGYVTPSITGT